MFVFLWLLCCNSTNIKRIIGIKKLLGIYFENNNYNAIITSVTFSFNAIVTIKRREEKKRKEYIKKPLNDFTQIRAKTIMKKINYCKYIN